MAAPLAFVRGGVVDGTFVVTRITDPLAGASDTNAFDQIRGHSIRFVIAFDRIDHEVNASLAGGGQRRILTTNPARVHFLGDPTGYLQEVVAPTLNGAMQITLREDASGTAVLEGFDIAEPRAPQYFGFKGAGPAAVSHDGRAPGTQAVGLDTDTMVLQRFGATLGMTDLATGSLHSSLFENLVVGVEPRAFGEIKAMYRTLE